MSQLIGVVSFAMPFVLENSSEVGLASVIVIDQFPKVKHWHVLAAGTCFCEFLIGLIYTLRRWAN